MRMMQDNSVGIGALGGDTMIEFNPFLSCALTALVSLCGVQRAGAQTSATYGFFGKGCQLGSLGEKVVFRVSGLPRIGKSIAIQTASPNLTKQVYVLTGISKTRYASIKLPFNTAALTRNGFTFCGDLRTSVEVVLVVARGRTTTLLIPNDKSLIGLRFYQQVMEATNIPARGLFADLSRGGEGRIGT